MTIQVYNALIATVCIESNPKVKKNPLGEFFHLFCTVNNTYFLFLCSKGVYFFMIVNLLSEKKYHSCVHQGEFTPCHSQYLLILPNWYIYSGKSIGMTQLSYQPHTNHLNYVVQSIILSVV